MAILRKVISILVLFLVALLSKSVDSFSFSDLWFGSSLPEGQAINSEYGECEWHATDTSMPSTEDQAIHISSSGSGTRARINFLKGGRQAGYGQPVMPPSSMGSESLPVFHNEQYPFTAAHRTLPLGSYATVTNENDGRSVVVQITEYGPYVDGRIMSLSRDAFNQIADLDKGVIPCRVSVK